MIIICQKFFLSHPKLGQDFHKFPKLCLWRGALLLQGIVFFDCWQLTVYGIKKKLQNFWAACCWFTLHCPCLENLGLALNELISKLTTNSEHCKYKLWFVCFFLWIQSWPQFSDLLHIKGTKVIKSKSKNKNIK